MNFSKVLVNGLNYNWCSVSVNILGVTLVGIKSINYSDRHEIEDIMGAGCAPVARGGGQYSAEGSVTLLMEEVEALQAAAPNGRIQEIPEFDITIDFEPENGRFARHVLKNCRFVTNMRDLQNQATSFEVELEMKVSHINWRG